MAVIETIRGGEHGDAARLSHRAAAAAVGLLDRLCRAGRHITGLVVSGGRTAACLIERLEPASIERELAPLCPRGRLVGGPLHV